MASNTHVHIQIDDSMGSVLIGTLFSAVLLGVTYTQTLYYFVDSPKDSQYVKALVACLALFDTIHMAFISHTNYHYLVSNFDNAAAIERLTWSVLLEALFTGITGFLVQCFFTTRIWRLSKNYLLTSITLFISVVSFGCTIAWVTLSMQMETFVELRTISPLTITINGLSAAVDVLIATSLVMLLRRVRTGFKRSDGTINRLIIFVVNTGVLTSCVAIAALISIAVSPKTLIYASFYFSIGRFYSNSLLATLNARKNMAAHMNDGTHMLASVPPLVLSPPSDDAGGRFQQNISIRIETTQMDDLDTQHSGKLDDENSFDDVENPKSLKL